LVAGFANKYLLPQIPQSELLGSMESVALSVGGNAFGTSAVYYIANPGALQSIGMSKILMISLVAEVGGQYVYDKFLSPMMKPADIPQ
jgi:hypothetical protein